MDDREAYVELAKLSQQSKENRNAIEWKVAFGLWTGIAVFTWFLVDVGVRLPSLALANLGVIYIGVLAIWTLCWQLPLHRANRRDGQWKHWFMDKAEQRTVSPAPDPRANDPVWWDSAKRPWLWGQVLMTLMFLALSFLIVANLPATRPDDETSPDRLTGDNVRTVLQKLPAAPTAPDGP